MATTNGVAGGPIDVNVVIVGGGGCGLSLSSMLSDQGVDHILFERHADTSMLPKAHYLNQRSMEIFRQHNMEGPILEKSGTMRYISRVTWSSSLAGDGPLDRKQIGYVNAFGGGEATEQANIYQKDSPLRSHNLPQIRLEPVLRKLAVDRNPGRVLFSHKVVDFKDMGDHVLVTVQTDKGEETQYRAKYMVGADGGKTVGPRIGVEMSGPTGIVDIVSTHFKADLSQYWDDRNFINHFINPEGGSLLSSGSLVPMGPTWGRFSEEWVFHFGFDLKDDTRWNEESLVPEIRRLLKIPDLDMKVLHVNHWLLERVLADKYQEGRIFIAGDAAHRHPPTTGLGLNTAVGDAHNLAWKLALVLRGQADPQLLDSYDLERRSVGKRNCDWGLMTFMNTSVINAAVGLVPGQAEMNNARFAALFEDSDVGATLRALVQDAISTQKLEFSAHDLELGYSYPSGALYSDGSSRPTPDPLGQVYCPTTRPGHRLPHAWVMRNASRKGHAASDVVSTHDFVGKTAEFALITDSAGTGWVQAASKVSETTGVSINVAVVDTMPLHGKNADYVDHNSAWETIREIAPGSALLVRPDNMVGWRSTNTVQDKTATLLEVVQSILYKKTSGKNVNEEAQKGGEFHVTRGNIQF